MRSYTVDGKVHGEYKVVENLSWLKVLEAGHSLPYYRESTPACLRFVKLMRDIEPETALQVFKQMMQRKPLKPT